MYTWSPPEDIAALAKEQAIIGGEKARLMIELEEGDYESEVVHESMRRRLARSLVQLGMRIDPLVGVNTRTEA